MQRPRDRSVFLLIAILSALTTIITYRLKPDFLTGVDLKALDAMFKARGASEAPQEVVIVAVDEKSVNEQGRWPWPRQKTARVLKRLRQARVTAVDMVFSESENPEADRVLAAGVKEAGNVVIGFFFRDDSTEEPVAEALKQLGRSRISLLNFMEIEDIPAEAVPAVEFDGIETNLPIIGASAAGFGAFNIIPQKDGLYRAANLVYKYKSNLYPSVAVEGLRRYLGDPVVLNVAEYGIDGVEVNDRTIPLDEEGALLLNFFGPGGTFKTYSATDVLEGRISPEEFKDKFVLFGVTEKAVYDIRPTPLDPVFPGVELLATIAGNVIKGSFLIHDSRIIIIELVLILLLPVFFSLAVSRLLSAIGSLFILAALFAALIGFEYYLFFVKSIRPVVVYPGLSLFLAYISIEAYRNIVVEKKSRYLRKAFSTYVSDDLVSEILKDPGRLKLGGEKRVVTVLFSDIRGFTGISEGLTPEKLVLLLNEYLNPMTMIVLERGGMLDKYIGDAIMAVFNAPVALPNHTASACEAAYDMLLKLKELNNEWGQRGTPHLDIGIGVNTGEAVVGNMGAEQRFNYTAIGDTVNLASRLEGLNKMYRTHIIVSEFTFAGAKDGFTFRELDYVRVKGKQKPIVIYELVSRKGEDIAKERFCSMFSNALALYRERRFSEAMDSFASALKEVPDDGPSSVYMERCRGYLTDPPPEDWDGVYAPKTK